MSENREMWKEIEFKLFEIGNIDLLIDNYKLTLFSFRERFILLFMLKENSNLIG